MAARRKSDRRPLSHVALAFAAFVVCTLRPAEDACAAGPFVDRPITLPAKNFAFDTGLGFGTVPRNDLIANSYTGAGMNLEAAWGIVDKIEVGLRTGLRFDFDGRVVGADAYARTYDLETYGTRLGNVTNPELRGRFAFLHLDPVELAGEVRIFLPIESGSHEGVMLGVPVALHFNHFVRIDTGAYLPILLYNPVVAYGSIPAHVWFQASEGFWIGPMTGLTFVPAGPNVVMGLGFGVQPKSWLDIRFQIVDPAVNHGVDRAGVGIGAQFRIE